MGGSGGFHLEINQLCVKSYRMGLTSHWENDFFDISDFLKKILNLWPTLAKFRSFSTI